jgi:hypothetical protein
MEPAVSVGSLRSVVIRAGVALGLTVTLLGSPGGLPATAPVVAQEATPVPKPPAFKPSGAQPSASPSAESQRPAADPAIPAPPAVAAGVFQDALTDSRIFRPGRCPTMWAGGDLVAEGYKLTVVGLCFEDASVADVTVPARGVTVGDGDVALDFKVLAGEARVAVSLYVRNRDRKFVGASVNLGAGQATLFRTDDGNITTLVSRDDIGGLVNPTDWNRLAIRVSGHDLGLLLNDEPALYATDALDQVGNVGLRALREGDKDDDQEAIVVFRDLTLSVLDGADPARAPTYNAP